MHELPAIANGRTPHKNNKQTLQIYLLYNKNFFVNE